MTVLGIDYAGGIPRAAAIKAAGYDFVCRYLTPGGRGLPGKLLKANEYADLQAHGISTVFNWETTADRMKDGFAAGVEDARSAQSVLDSLGVPATVPVFLSADWDASEAEQQVIDNYLHGARSVLGAQRIGVYGSFYVVRRCLNNGSAVWAWQAGAWSGGQIEPRAHIYQRIGFATVDGVECDVNEARQINFGQHPAPTNFFITDIGDEEHDTVHNIAINDTGRVLLICPTGDAAANKRQAWLSAAVLDLKGAAWVQVYVQSLTGGIADWRWTEADLSASPDNLVRRAWKEIPNNASHLIVSWDVSGAPSGGALCLETKTNA